MQAVTNDQYGSPEVLTWSEVDRPRVGPRDVLVRVHASTVTQGDRRLRAADYPGFTGPLGRLFSGVLRPRHRIGGSNFAGRVVEVGAEVKRFAVGDDVFGSTLHGAYAEYLAVREDSAVELMPQSTGYAEAAALPYGGGTALVFLRDLARVQPGERVLIVGASGGVGRFAVQVAKRLGANVTAVCSADSAELVRSLGADDVIDYRTQNYLQHGARWDVVFNTIEGDHFRAARQVLSEKGRYLTLYMTLRVLFEMLMSKLFGGPRALVGVAMGSAKLLSELRQLADEGALADVISRRFALEHAAAAHAFLEDARPHGSVVLDVIGGAAQRETFKGQLAEASVASERIVYV